MIANATRPMPPRIATRTANWAGIGAPRQSGLIERRPSVDDALARRPPARRADPAAAAGRARRRRPPTSRRRAGAGL